MAVYLTRQSSRPPEHTFSIEDAHLLQIFEMNNGCICCTVRGDLIRILNKLLKRKNKLDAIMIETTGLANPAPVIQTFFVDDNIKDACVLDAVLTVVDAKHVMQHLDEEKPEGVVNEAGKWCTMWHAACCMPMPGAPSPGTNM